MEVCLQLIVECSLLRGLRDKVYAFIGLSRSYFSFHLTILNDYHDYKYIFQNIGDQFKHYYIFFKYYIHNQRLSWSFAR